MLYDVHTHAFHPAIAPTVLGQMAARYGIPPAGDGTMDDLAARAASAGLDRFVVLTAATAPAQVVPANNWAIRLGEQWEGAVPFGSVHPGFPRWEQELDRLAAHGIRGLKIHPEFQRLRLDDPALEPVFEAAQGRFVLMVHVGGTAPSRDNPSCPRKLRRVSDDFPGLAIIAAHMGGYLQWENALDGLIGSRVHIDTSSTLPYIDDATLAAILRRHPRERILFGSDYPLFDPGQEVERLRKRLALSSAELEEMLSSAHHLLG